MGSNNLALVGLAVRAGKAVFGTAACEKGIKQRKVSLLLWQQGISESTLKGFTELCRRSGVKMLMISGEGRLGAAIGKPGIKLLGITDAGFTAAILNKSDGGSALNE